MNNYFRCIMLRVDSIKNIQLLCHIRLIVMLAMLIFFSGAYADNIDLSDETEYAELSLKELTELDVFSAANLLPTKKAKAPGTVYSFDRQDFDRMGVRRLEDVLAFVPGFQVNQYRKRHRSIWARGLLDLYNDKLVLVLLKNEWVNNSILVFLCGAWVYLLAHHRHLA